MFKTARMRKIRIVTLDEYISPTVSALHEQGLVQINEISDSIQQDPELAELVTPSKASAFTGKLSSLLMKTSAISKIILVVIFLVSCFKVEAQNIVSDTIKVSAGNLNVLLGDKKDLITNLTLKGKINGTDITVADIPPKYWQTEMYLQIAKLVYFNDIIDLVEGDVIVTNDEVMLLIKGIVEAVQSDDSPKEVN